MLQPARLLCPWHTPGKNTGMGCHFLLQGIFPTQETNPGLLHCWQRLLPSGRPWAIREVQKRELPCESESHVRLFVTPWTIIYQAPWSLGFSRQEYWSGLPFPSPGDLPNPGIEPRSPSLQADSLPSEPPGKPGQMPY